MRSGVLATMPCRWRSALIWGVAYMLGVAGCAPASSEPPTESMATESQTTKAPLTPKESRTHDVPGTGIPREPMVAESAREPKPANRQEAAECCARGVELAVARRFSESKEQFAKVLELDPFSHAATTGLAMVESASNGRTRPDIAVHMFRGVKYARDGKRADAIVEWLKAVELDSSYLPAYTNLGAAYLDDKGTLEKARQCFQKVLAADPDNGAAQNDMGLYWVHKGDMDKALSEFERAVALKPTPGALCMALNNAGLAYEAKGMRDAAISMFQNALSINPNDAEAHDNLAGTYYHKGEFELAIQHCDKAKELGREIHPDLAERLRPYR